ncbi:MAG: AraC family transcriptional regulator [Gammaproteobacteria bacterium]|nr:AraC family transcriptional regulator [Gammaproteobacteria bacterium]
MKINDSLKALRKALRSDPYLQEEKSSLHGLGVYHCHQLQKLRAVPLLQPMIMLVVTGHKEVTIEDRTYAVHSGELFIAPSDTTLWIKNNPDPCLNDYQALGLPFSFETQDHFRQVYGADLEHWDIQSKWHEKAPETILFALCQWFYFCRNYAVDTPLVQHRQVEILLLLAQAGLAGNLLFNTLPSWRQRVSNLIAMHPAKTWQVIDVCTRLGISESGLRRHLQEEGSNFRKILEEVRLALGLSLIMETFKPISDVADAVGYRSQSRFGERFKRRFGLTPSELRRTRIPN